jgi:hypothetical protein
MRHVHFPVLSLRARSPDIPINDHPNRMPFSGVLTRIDDPSDAAPEGSNGKRILLTMDAATVIGCREINNSAWPAAGR